MQGGVRKRGDTWYYYFDMGIVDGKRVRPEYSASAEGARTKAEAEAILRKKIAQYENTGIIFKASEITVHDFLMYWQKEYVALKLTPRTQENYETTIRIHILPHLGSYKLKSLRPETLQNFFNEKVREGWAKQTLSIMFGIMSKSLKHAVYPYKYINETPMQYVELMVNKQRKPTKDDLKIQSTDNLKKISRYLPESHPFYLPFHIGLHCGLRVGEVCGLEWRHINFDERTIEVEQQLVAERDVNGKHQWVIGPPKSISGYRTISIGDTLIRILKSALRTQKQNQLKYGEHYKKSSLGDFVCKKENGDHCTPNVIKYHTRETIGVKLGIKFNYHSLRHTHATMLIEKGTPIKTVQKRLGHSRAAITEDRYVHLTKKMSRDAADIFDSIAEEF
ncbi:MAG: site-specific integrase [Lysinibacillus sp.]